jgi:hypothetical protein
MDGWEAAIAAVIDPAETVIAAATAATSVLSVLRIKAPFPTSAPRLTGGRIARHT